MMAHSTIRNVDDSAGNSFAFMEEVDSAIQYIFDAFETTSSHDEAVRYAKEKAAQSVGGEQKERTVQVIGQLGRMMDRDYWSAPSPHVFSRQKLSRNG